MKRIPVLLVISILTALGSQLSSQERKEGAPGIVVDKEARTVSKGLLLVFYRGYW